MQNTQTQPVEAGGNLTTFPIVWLAASSATGSAGGGFSIVSSSGLATLYDIQSVLGFLSLATASLFLDFKPHVTFTERTAAHLLEPITPHPDNFLTKDQPVFIALQIYYISSLSLCGPLHIVRPWGLSPDKPEH